MTEHEIEPTEPTIPETAPLQPKLLQSDDLFRKLVDSVTDYAIFVLDIDGRVVTWNAGAQRIKGYAAHEIIGDHFSRFYPIEDIRAGKCEYELAGATRDGRFEDEGWRIRKDGSRFWANVVISAVHDDNGMVTGFSKVTRDLTERRRSEEERAARLIAEHSNRMKDQFLAVLGHELRNPLAPIVTALQILKLRGDTRSAKEHAVIERQTRHMMRLVDDLLDVSRISRGAIQLRQEPIDLRDAIAKALEISGPAIEAKGHRLEVEVPRTPLPIDGDEGRLVQVFANLVNNAAKYTEERGRIHVAVKRKAGQIVVDIKDSGSGIDPALIDQLFELFVQGPQDAARQASGLGLGLALVKSLVVLHGGTVEARSPGLGYGATFTVTLPALARPVALADTTAEDFETEIETADARPSAVGRAPDSGVGAALATGSETGRVLPAKRRIFVVDDNEDARVLLVDMLTAMGHDARGAADATSALAMVDEFHPDVAILDIGLPEMDGYELAVRIREGAASPADVPRLIALTGYSSPAEQEKSRAAGFDLHLVKPVDIKRLLEHVS